MGICFECRIPKKKSTVTAALDPFVVHGPERSFIQDEAAAGRTKKIAIWPADPQPSSDGGFSFRLK